MTQAGLRSRLVRYGELIPCKSAFIDAHTPGSDQKENFTIIGGGVSESADQHVHVNEAIGFNIGAAGQPPGCRNSMHSHRTAEVFFVLKGRWRFFWGLHGTAGEVTLEEGDIINIPTGIFRGFENTGTDYGMIMAVLGGNNAGGGVIWAPHVIEDATAHGLVLGENGQLYDTNQGQKLPDAIRPMPLLSDKELRKYPEPRSADVVPGHVARYWDMMSLADRQAAKVIGEHAMLRDKPGFEVDFLTRGSIPETVVTTTTVQVLMPMRGHWRVTVNSEAINSYAVNNEDINNDDINNDDISNGNVNMGAADNGAVDNEMEILAPGDTLLVPEGVSLSLSPSMTGEASLFRVTPTNGPAGPTWYPQ